MPNTALDWPSYYVITDHCDDSLFALRFCACLSRGYRLFQLRDHNLVGDALKKRIQYARQLVAPSSDQPVVRWLLNGSVAQAEASAADGVHLNSRRLMALSERPALAIVAASCHNTTEIHQANRIGVDFIVLSPVLPTATHPQAEPLGWQCFTQWLQLAQMPVYALGGLQVGHLAQAKQCGAQGIAAIGGLWQKD